MSLKKGEGVKTFKDTFWSKKRVEAGVTIQELAEGIGVKKGTLCSYLIGVSVPKESVIRAMCDWFGVDYVQGEREFYNAHRAYDAQSKGKAVVAMAKPKKKAEKTVEVKKVQETTKPNTNAVCGNKEIYKLLYGKIGCEEYNKVYELVKSNANIPLDLIYGKVDRITYELVKDMQSGKIARVEDFDNKWNI